MTNVNNIEGLQLDFSGSGELHINLVGASAPLVFHFEDDIPLAKALLVFIMDNCEDKISSAGVDEH